MLALAGLADALARPGEFFPIVTAKDLTGQMHRTDELVGRRTLVVAITDKDAADAMRAWYVAAGSHMPPSVVPESIISLHLPFFVSTDFVRNRAREQVPAQFWHATLVDRGDMAEHLGLEESKTPYVFALDEDGRIMAVVHAPVQSPQAEMIWTALSDFRNPSTAP